jgi:hypothetical protein
MGQHELAAEDWRKLLAAGKESFTQVLGRAVAEAGSSGLLARSAAVKRGINVVIFPGVCRADELTVFLAALSCQMERGRASVAQTGEGLCRMDRLLDALARVMQPEQVGHWLKSPNQAFDGSTPLQVVGRGEIDRIWRMLYDLKSGQPG